jgi:hypothetical protein
MEKMVSIRFDDPTLTGAEIKRLITEGAKLFELMRLTVEAEQYLEYHPQLKAVIDKW